MFRRLRRGPGHLWPPLRPFARPLASPTPPIPPAVLEAHQRANRLMDNGGYTDAAAIYEQLARLAQAANHPRQAAHLFLQAGRALILAGQPAEGIKLAQTGLGILADAEQWEAFNRAGARAVGELDLQGQKDAAQQLSTWISAQRKQQPPAISTTDEAPPKKSDPGRLPRQCPSCGAPVRPNEIEWLDDTTAECAYCGSILQSEAS
jgi:hypothetical protein